jgi:hypothetical protein
VRKDQHFAANAAQPVIDGGHSCAVDPAIETGTMPGGPSGDVV